MIVVSKPLITKRFTGEEFKNKSVLNEGVTIEDIQRRVEKKFKENAKRRRQHPIHGNRKKY